MLNEVLNGREVLIFGKNPFELISAYYNLALGNVKVKCFVYHNLDEITENVLSLDNWNNYSQKNYKYYIVVADNENYSVSRSVIIESGYNPIKDFIRWRPLPYKK